MQHIIVPVRCMQRSDCLLHPLKRMDSAPGLWLWGFFLSDATMTHSATAHALTPLDYVKKILTARVYDVAIESDLQLAHDLSRRLNNRVLLKREDQQPVFSFKLRGAYNKMAHLSPEQLARGVICASAGNHAQGVAMSARRLGTRAVVVMPTTTPQVKVDAVKTLGAEVVLHGESYSTLAARAGFDLCASV